VLHVVEPTLKDEKGHCYSFARSLCAAAGGDPISLWVARDARLPAMPAGVVVRPHFHRRFRRIQAPLLYRKLLAGDGRILVETAERNDLLFLDWAAGGRRIPPGKVFLYFHWYRERAGKRRMLARVARRQPDLGLFGPTPTVVRVLRECGFPRVDLVPYPISGPGSGTQPGAGSGAATGAAEDPPRFRRVLFAGAARQDKGFGAFADLVVHLAATGATTPVAVQANLDRVEGYDDATRRDLGRLRAARYAPLEALPDPLPADAYAASFAGGICVQPYDAAKFADRVSGVTLDALTAGCPVVAVQGTWSARVVERFGAGRVVPDTRPETLLAAVRAIVAAYGPCSEAARRGGRVLLEENDARRLYAAMAAAAPGGGAPAASA
jgi:hypothetical protein